jgi:hypothetical protein
MRRQGRNRRQVLLPDKGMGVGTTTFMARAKKVRAGCDAHAMRHARMRACYVDRWFSRLSH